jgi:predicted RNA methylase
MVNGITVGIILVCIFLFAGFILTLLVSLLLPPLFGTPKKVLDEIVQLMDLEKDDILVDLGSGDGRLLLSAFGSSSCRCIGYDISPISLIIANTKKLVRFPLSKDISFEAEDVFDIDFSNASKVYCFLDERGMDILRPKLESFIKNGGEVFSYVYDIPNVKGKEVELSNGERLWVYGVTRSK